MFIPSVLLISGVICSGWAAGNPHEGQTTSFPQASPQAVEREPLTPKATFSYRFDTAPGSVTGVTSPLIPLEAQETVTINALCSPSTSSMDFGLIAPDGYFYYQNVKNGKINLTIQVEESGNYMLAVRNQSDHTVRVAGFIHYDNLRTNQV